VSTASLPFSREPQGSAGAALSCGSRLNLSPALVAVALHAALLAVFVAAYHGDLSALVCASSERAGQHPYKSVHVSISRCGYDGMYYYAIARSPWRRHDVGLDAPAARHARILYPALAWLVSGGGGRRLLWALPLINLLAIGALAWIGSAAARARGLSPWWGVLLPLAVNAGMPALRDLSDVVSSAAVAGLLAGRLLRWPTAATIGCAAAALLGREQNLVVVAGVLAVALWRREWTLAMGLSGAAALWAGWMTTLRIVYGEWPLLPSQGNIAAPFEGLAYAWTHLPGPSGSTLVAALNAFCLLMLTLQIAMVIGLARLRPDPAVLLTALGGVALAVLGGVYIYQDRWSFMRVLAWLPLALWLGFVAAGRRTPLLLLAASALLPVQAALTAWVTTG
jgi:hypothetical protein